VKPRLKQAIPTRFVIDWADLKKASLDSIDGKASQHFKNSTNQRVATEALRGGSWNGYTGGQLRRWLHEGYQSGEALDLTTLVPIREQRKYVFNDEDGEFNLDLVLSGEDRYYSEWTREENIPGLAIEAEICMSAATSERVLCEYFRWLNQAIYSLETAGIDIQLDLIYDCASGLFQGHDAKRFVTQIRVKQEGEISDFNSWSAMVSPASLRGLMFTAICLHAESSAVQVQWGLGRRDRTDWGVKYDRERAHMMIQPAWNDSAFPQSRMDAQFKSALEEIKRGLAS